MAGLKNYFEDVLSKHNPENFSLPPTGTFRMDLGAFQRKFLKTLRLPDKSIVVKNDVVRLRAGYSYPNELDLAALTLRQRIALYKNEKSTLQALILKAEEGDCEAQYHLGAYYLTHFESADDLSRSLEMFKRSAEQGNIDALNSYVSRMLDCKKVQMMTETSFDQDLDLRTVEFIKCAKALQIVSDQELVSHMKTLINQGYEFYIREIAYFYYHGFGVEKDEFLAFVTYFFSIAYEDDQGESILEADIDFQKRLVDLYLRFFDDEFIEGYRLKDYLGEEIFYGLEEDHEALLVKGFDFDQLELAEKVLVAFVMDYFNNDISLQWFQKISEIRPHSYIDLKMVTILEQSSKIESNHALIQSYLNQVSDENHVIKLHHLSVALIETGNYQLAVENLERAATLGSLPAHKHLVEIYRKGLSGEFHYEKAFAHLAHLLNIDNPDIIYLRGKMMLKGQGTAQDEKQAMQLIENAAAKGQKNAKYRLGAFYGQQGHIDQMLYWWLQASLSGHDLASMRAGLYFFSRLDEAEDYRSLAQMVIERVMSQSGQKMNQLLGLLATWRSIVPALKGRPLTDGTRSLVALTVADIYYQLGRVYNKLTFVEEALVHYEKSKQLGNLDIPGEYKACEALKIKLTQSTD